MIERTLIITGCINPVEQKYLTVTDAEERLKQYIASIAFYIENSLCNHIIFCENSLYQYDCSELYLLSEQNKKYFEWMSFKGDFSSVQKRGKGVGEGEIIDYATSHSKFPIYYIEKVTGRLIIENIAEIERKLKTRTYINADINIFLSGEAYDTRFYACSIGEYQNNISKCYKQADDSCNKNIEKLLFLNIKNVVNIPRYPTFKGKSGGFGYEYGNEAKVKKKCLNFLCMIHCFNRKMILKATRKLLISIHQW